VKKSVKPSRLDGRRQALKFIEQTARAEAAFSTKLQELTSMLEKQEAHTKEKLEPLRRRLMTEDERFREDGEKRDRARREGIAESIRSGDLTKFYEAINYEGPHVFTMPEVQKVLRHLWLRTVKDETAREGSVLIESCKPSSP
jgi:hypothetical protein